MSQSVAPLLPVPVEMGRRAGAAGGTLGGGPAGELGIVMHSQPEPVLGNDGELPAALTAATAKHRCVPGRPPLVTVLVAFGPTEIGYLSYT